MRVRTSMVMAIVVAVLAWAGTGPAAAQQTQTAPGRVPALEVTYYFLPG